MDETSTKLVILALGANVSAEANIANALGLLQEHLSSIRHTQPIWTTPIGLQTENFLNCIVQGQCDMAYEELHKLTKEIERECGDTAEKRKNSEIAMDIDILLHCGKKYHRQDWKRQYIKEGMERLKIEN